MKEFNNVTFLVELDGVRIANFHTLNKLMKHKNQEHLLHKIEYFEIQNYYLAVYDANRTSICTFSFEELYKTSLELKYDTMDFMSVLLSEQRNIHYLIFPEKYHELAEFINIEAFNVASKENKQRVERHLFNQTALMAEECFEAIRELPARKYSNTSKVADLEKFKNEVIDSVMIGFSILAILGISSDEFMKTYSSALTNKVERIFQNKRATIYTQQEDETSLC